jgi:hypothetical protein
MQALDTMTEIECELLKVETELLKVKTELLKVNREAEERVADAEADAEDRVKLAEVRAETAEAAATEANNKIKAVLTMLGETSDESRLLVDEVLIPPGSQGARRVQNPDKRRRTTGDVPSYTKEPSIKKSKPASNKKSAPVCTIDHSSRRSLSVRGVAAQK